MPHAATESDPAWVCIYTSPDSLDGRLLAARLRAEGITPRVTRLRSASLGVLGLGDPGAELWVLRPHAEAAREVVHAWRTDDPRAGVEVRCEACDAQVPGSFEVCWACEHPLPLDLPPARHALPAQ